MLVPGSIPNIIFSKSFKRLLFIKWKSFYKNTFFISLILFAIAIIYLSAKIFEHKSLIFALKDFLNFRFLFFLFLVFSLQFVNWFLESIKLKILLNRHYSKNIKTVLKAIYAGNFTALITPKRIGNFIGRFLILNENKRLVTILTFFGNSYQLLITLIMSVLGLFWLVLYDFSYVFISDFQSKALVLFYSLFLIILFGLLFNLNWLNYLNRFKWFYNWGSNFKDLNSIPIFIRLYVLVLSASRYFIFILQYYIFVVAFNLPVDLFQVTLCLGVLFGLVTLTPSFLPGNLGTREAICVLILGGGVLGLQFSLISFMVWFINVGCSAIIGGFLLLNNKR